MSMNNYAICDYGCVLTQEMKKAFIKKNLSKIIADFNFDPNTSIDEIMDYTPEINEFLSDTFDIICDSCIEDPIYLTKIGQNDIDYSDKSSEYEDEICYIPLHHAPKFFKAAYTSIDEIVSEIKSQFSDDQWPDISDEEIKNNLFLIEYVIFG